MGQGVFSHFLVKGLQGAASRDDNIVEFNELAQYVESHVKDWTFAHLNQLQQPFHRSHGELFGRFIVTAKGRIRPGVGPNNPPLCNSACQRERQLQAQKRQQLEQQRLREQRQREQQQAQRQRLQQQQADQRQKQQLALADRQRDQHFDQPKPQQWFEPAMLQIPGRNYSLAKHEVTVRQYLACVSAKACREPEWREPGSEFNIKTGNDDRYKKLGGALTGDRYPIVGVNFSDAVKFTQWLSQQTGKKYRLPTSDEWQYAVIGDTQNKYPWGNEVGRNRANCRGCGSRWDDKSTAPVGSFSANRGLYDTLGNVAEWTTARDGKYSQVLRGGSWYNDPGYSRSTYLGWRDKTKRDVYIGFRVASTP